MRKLVPFVACGDLSGWDKESLADEQASATGEAPHAHMEPQSTKQLRGLSPERRSCGMAQMMC